MTRSSGFQISEYSTSGLKIFVRGFLAAGRSFRKCIFIRLLCTVRIHVGIDEVATLPPLPGSADEANVYECRLFHIVDAGNGRS